MKKFITGFVIAAILFSLAPSLADTNLKDIIASPNNYPIYVNGEDVDVEAYNIDGYTYLKIADIANVFNDGTEAMFNQTKEIIEITHKRNNANIKPEKNTTVKKYEKEGYNILNYHGTELISLKEIEEAYKDSYDKGYWEFLIRKNNLTNKKNRIFYNLFYSPLVDHNDDGVKDIRRPLMYMFPAYNVNNDTYVEYKIFKKNIKFSIESVMQ